ncbi:Hypothetical predicted protein, partial [Olea europaea subsp. europaea]
MNGVGRQGGGGVVRDLAWYLCSIDFFSLQFIGILCFLTYTRSVFVTIASEL